MVVHIESRDGTTIGFRRLGQGPGLVVVHGSIATGDEWSRVASVLADRFTVHLVDRRGRGLSGDADAYSIDTEIADIAAVLDAAGPDASLVGHSYGALCALAAVASGVDVPGLVLYERRCRSPGRSPEPPSHRMRQQWTPGTSTARSPSP